MSNYDLVDYFCQDWDLFRWGGFEVRRKFTARFWLFMIVTMLIVFSVSFGVLQHRYRQGEQQLTEICARRNELILEIQDLEKELAYSKTDDYIVRAAKDQLGYIMPGEVRYVNGAR